MVADCERAKALPQIQVEAHRRSQFPIPLGAYLYGQIYMDELKPKQSTTLHKILSHLAGSLPWSPAIQIAYIYNPLTQER